jgi:hypothetical protein
MCFAMETQSSTFLVPGIGYPYLEYLWFSSFLQVIAERVSQIRPRLLSHFRSHC